MAPRPPTQPADRTTFNNAKLLESMVEALQQQNDVLPKLTPVKVIIAKEKTTYNIQHRSKGNDITTILKKLTTHKPPTPDLENASRTLCTDKNKSTNIRYATLILILPYSPVY
ncbi:hypothetical protein LR48_Vigan06g084200 [Vigna angularis]|uniref:Uncharacterized protein n=1 Tax=Phaseolus angularis TaxID=3914 RepID=A0A0L9US56_PHAAN|nr:hypothetical protein LR48_Vigan06g084200 [Vigna angularis]